MENVKDNNQTIEEKYKRLYEFTKSILLAHNRPQDYENNYEVMLAELTIKSFEVESRTTLPRL
jgi:hypothetical protein